MSHLTHRRSILAGMAALPLAGMPQPGRAEAGKERPFNLRIIMSGHSLTDPIPSPLGIIVQAAGGPAALGSVIDNSSIPGSPAEIRWDNDLNLPVDARRDMENYDLLVLTERVPIRPTAEYHHSKDIALKFFDRAWTAGNAGKGAETVFYATWVGINSGPGNDDPYDVQGEMLIPFRERLDLEMVTWQEIADYVNQNRPSGSPKMNVMPGPRLMQAVFDAISAGTAPGLARMQDLFEDNIHVNDKGAFLVALALFSVIYGRDPHSVPTLRGKPGWPTAEQQDWMKTLVWDVLKAYPDSGLT